MQNRSSQWFIPIVLALGAAAALWYYWMRVSEPEGAGPPPPAEVEEPAADIGPLHPVEPQGGASPRPELVPLPPLDQADAYFRLGVVDVVGDAIDSQLAESGIIAKIVATVDNLPRSHVAERVRPLGRLEAPFVVDAGEAGGDYLIGSSNYARYDALVDLAMSADLPGAAELYRRFYPLFQQAYENLGYPDAYFNDRLVEVIDHLLATPEIADSVALVRPHVLYEYADPDLEALSSGQKLLLRMGGDHRARLKERLQELRELVTSL